MYYISWLEHWRRQDDQFKMVMWWLKPFCSYGYKWRACMGSQEFKYSGGPVGPTIWNSLDTPLQIMHQSHGNVKSGILCNRRTSIRSVSNVHSVPIGPFLVPGWQLAKEAVGFLCYMWIKYCCLYEEVSTVYVYNVQYNIVQLAKILLYR